MCIEVSNTVQQSLKSQNLDFNSGELIKETDAEYFVLIHVKNLFVDLQREGFNCLYQADCSEEFCEICLH